MSESEKQLVVQPIPNRGMTGDTIVYNYNLVVLPPNLSVDCKGCPLRTYDESLGMYCFGIIADTFGPNSAYLTANAVVSQEQMLERLKNTNPNCVQAVDGNIIIDSTFVE